MPSVASQIGAQSAAEFESMTSLEVTEGPTRTAREWELVTAEDSEDECSEIGYPRLVSAVPRLHDNSRAAEGTALLFMGMRVCLYPCKTPSTLKFRV